MTPPGELAMFLAIGAGAVGLLFGPIGSAVARRLGGRSEPPDAALRDEIDHLHQRLAEFEPMQARMVELEERLDFAERLLAQGKDEERLPR
jgi:hypothetical protein